MVYKIIILWTIHDIHNMGLYMTSHPDHYGHKKHIQFITKLQIGDSDRATS